MRTEPALQFPMLAREHKALHQLVLDVELVILVLAVAFILHSVVRAIWSFFQLGHPAKTGGLKKASRESLLPKDGAPRGTFPRDLPPPSYGTGVFAKVVHEKLSGPVSEAELMPFLQEHLQSFSLANTVHAIVKCGKLQVTPGPVWDALIEKVGGSAGKLKVRGVAHVLWGMARVQPGAAAHGATQDAAVAALSGKWAELKGSDLLSAVWAVAELRGDTKELGPSFDRVKKVLGCAGKALQASLPNFTLEELASLLETLASAKFNPPEGESAPAAPMVVAVCTALLNMAKTQKKEQRRKADLQLPLPEAVKIVVALSALVRQGCIGTDREPGELFRGLAGRVADVRTTKGTQFRTAVQTFAKLRAEDVGVGCFDKLARSAVLLNFGGLPRKQLVQLAAVLGPVAAAHPLECGSEFFLELAQQLNALEPALGADDTTSVRAAFEQVGHASMLR